MATEWYVMFKNGRIQGPLSAAMLKGMAAAGYVTADFLVRKGNSGDWFAAKQIGGLFDSPAPIPQVPAVPTTTPPPPSLEDSAPANNNTESVRCPMCGYAASRSALNCPSCDHPLRPLTPEEKEKARKAEEKARKTVVAEGVKPTSYPALTFLAQVNQAVGVLCILGAFIFFVVGCNALNHSAHADLTEGQWDHICAGYAVAGFLVCAFWSVVCFSTAEFLGWLRDMKTGSTATNLLLQQLIQKIERQTGAEDRKT